MATIEVLVPVAAVRMHERPLAPRLDGPDGLAGRRIGVLDNQKANAARLVETVVDELTGRSGGSFDVVREAKAAPAGAPAEVMDRLLRCDAVVLAIAD
jgi:hypothetical protein